MSIVQQMAAAQHIYDTYVRPNNCPIEINVDEKACKSIQVCLEKRQAQTCFTLAQQAVYKLLEGSFTRFLESHTWAILVRETKNHNASIYPPHLVRLVVQLLRHNLERGTGCCSLTLSPTLRCHHPGQPCGARMMLERQSSANSACCS